MNSIVVALPKYPSEYDSLIEKLESEYIISDNASSQEKSIDLLQTIDPHFFVLQRDLIGTRDFEDYLKLLMDSYSDVTIILYNDNIEDIISMINGDKEIPSIVLDFVDESSEEETEDDQHIDEKLKQRSWNRIVNAEIDVTGYLKKTIAISGFSGGVGTTDIAINLAARSNTNGFKTAILGFDLQDCNLEERLGLERKRGKGLVAAHQLYLTGEMTVSALEGTMYEKNGLNILIGPEYPEDTEEMNEAFFVEIMEVLKNEYDLVIIDTENNSYSPALFPVLSMVDHILVPCTTHVSHLRSVQKGLQNLKDNYDFILSKVDIIHNKAGEGGVLNKEYIDKNTHRECIAEIPYTKLMFYAVESEIPLVNKNGTYPIQQAFDKLLIRYTGRVTKDNAIKKPFRFKLLREVIEYAKFKFSFLRSS